MTMKKHDPRLVKAAAKVSAAQPKTPNALIALVMSMLPLILNEVLKGEGRKKYRAALLVAKKVLDDAGLDEPSE